jgi:hypothetical protein
MSFHFPFVLAKQGEIAFFDGDFTSVTLRAFKTAPSSVW